jgi:hypothetical protein
VQGTGAGVGGIDGHGKRYNREAGDLPMVKFLCSSPADF